MSVYVSLVYELVAYTGSGDAILTGLVVYEVVAANRQTGTDERSFKPRVGFFGRHSGFHLTLGCDGVSGSTNTRSCFYNDHTLFEHKCPVTGDKLPP